MQKPGYNSRGGYQQNYNPSRGGKGPTARSYQTKYGESK